jgi:hypothetical protein
MSDPDSTMPDAGPPIFGGRVTGEYTASLVHRIAELETKVAQSAEARAAFRLVVAERDRYRDAIAAYQAVYDDTESREPWEYDAAADELFAAIGQISAWRAGS